MWTARRILKELADADRRRAILTTFWKTADQQHRMIVQMQLARSLNFREETVRKMPPEKKADLLASRIGVPDFDQYLEMALMTYHTTQKSEMLAAFLDRWNVPHENGSIESDDYKVPSADEVRAAAKELTQFDPQDVKIYLATAGLLMAEGWRDSTWPVVDSL
ncbi:MAG TPA: hypothetical protein VEO54_19695 [Thermoanaerobaculia bacterium]|nr:hypothetical protein [Thermoanaerobaculia bacterium]